MQADCPLESAAEDTDGIPPRIVVVGSGRPVELEISAHALPKALREDVRRVFCEEFEAKRVEEREFKLIITVQHTRSDILAVNQETAREKDECLERFMLFSEAFCSWLAQRGLWADYCDPCSGLPMLSGGNIIYPEILGLEKARKFRTTNAGCCRVALHPVWGANMYPATLFTTAPYAMIEEAISSCKTIDFCAVDEK